MEETIKSGVRRRDVLTGIGASVALTAAGSGTATATPPEGQSVGERGFNEVLLTYDGAPDVPLGGIDPMSHYQINSSERQLVLQAPIGRPNADFIEQNPHIIAFGAIPTYHEPGAVLGGEQSIQPKITAIHHLSTPDGIPSPEITTRPGPKQSLVVAAEGKEMTVETGSTGVLTLDEISVEYFTMSGDFITIEDREGNPVRARQSEIDTTTLTPKITAYNHDELEVYKPDEVWE